MKGTGLEGKSVLVVTDSTLWKPGGGNYVRFSTKIDALLHAGLEIDFVTSRILDSNDVGHLKRMGFSVVKCPEPDLVSDRSGRGFSGLRAFCPEFVLGVARRLRKACRSARSRYCAEKPQVPNIAEVRCAALEELVGNRLEEKAYDYVNVEYILYAGALEPLWKMPQRRRPVTMIDTHDVAYQRCAALRSRGISIPFEIDREQEKEIIRKFDIVIAIQDEDKNVFSGMCPFGTVVTLYPTVSVDPLGTNNGDQSKVVAFFGGKGYSGPNEEGVGEFLKHAWPLVRQVHPNATFVVYGDTRDAFTGRSFPGVVWKGFVPDLREAYRTSDVVISPIMFGGGLKTKVLEALAYGRPVVASLHSAIGYPDSQGRGLLVVKDWRSFAESINRLFDSPGHLHEHSTWASDYVAKYFSESVATRDLFAAMRNHQKVRGTEAIDAE
ncbi:MAG: glycosyltransferase [Verrucomicrobiota bacterium]